MGSNLGYGVLLDLDQTLVITQAIEPLRRAKRWSEAYRSFDQTYLPPQTKSFVVGVKKLARVGVVTNSPRPYAKRLLAHHGLDLDLLVTYWDVRNHKPHPEPILKAAELIGIPVEKCIHVGDSATDIEASLRANAITVAATWGSPDGPQNAGVQLWAKNWQEVMQFIRSRVGG